MNMLVKGMDYALALWVIGLSASSPSFFIAPVHAQTLSLPGTAESIPVSPIAAANDLYDRAVQLQAAGQYEDATALYQQALAIYRQQQAQLEVGLSLQALGTAYQKIRQHNEAIQVYQEALTIFQQLNEQEFTAQTLYSLGVAFVELANYSTAIDFYQQSLAIYQQLARDHPSTAISTSIANLYHRLGVAYVYLSDYANALDYYQQSLGVRRAIGDRNNEDDILLNIGIVYNELGQYAIAAQYYEQALAIAEETNDLVNQGRIWNSIGLNYAKQYQYEQALTAYQHSLDLHIQASNLGGQGRTLTNLADAYLNLNRYEQAIATLEQALQVAQTMGDRRFEGKIFDSLGDAYRALGQDANALAVYGQALTIAEEIGDRESAAKTLSNIATVYSNRQQPEVAIAFLKRAIAIYEDIRQDLRSLDTALQLSYTDTVANTYRQLANLLLQQQRIIEAQQVLELLKLEELREFTGNVRGLESGGGIALNAVEAQILDEFGTLVAFGKQVYDCEQTRCAQLSEYRQQRQEQSIRFDTQVTAFIQTIRDNRQSDDFFYDPRYLSETARDIVAQPGTLLIYPFVTEERVWLLYTSAGDVAGAIPIDVNQLELGEAVVHFRELLESPRSNLDELQATGKQLYDWLIAPLERELQDNNITTLVFAQDRVTRYIPMAALWDGEQYLAQRYTLSTILSAELTDMSDRRPSNPADTQVFALGLSQSVLDLAPLPNVEHELDVVVRAGDTDPVGIYPGLTLLNADFNREALLANLFGHRIVHIATHGSFVAGLPEESFLVLGDGNRFSIPDITSIGSDLRDVNLVVLSACETAVGGAGADGIEVAGISSYFLAANRASAVIASLWLVNDCSTSVLMQHFYESLAQGMTKAGALRQAQLSLLNGEVDLGEGCSDRFFNVAPRDGATAPQVSSEGYTHPYYWAPFILIGNGL